ncbi:unnamed protein product [Linum trigynum]|uniref:Uncharacterized protein n=1 Tax=Linum trigynum TaxID=586398 RepID=A0AAV2G0G1_9ROSI
MEAVRPRWREGSWGESALCNFLGCKQGHVAASILGAQARKKQTQINSFLLRYSQFFPDTSSQSHAVLFSTLFFSISITTPISSLSLSASFSPSPKDACSGYCLFVFWDYRHQPADLESCAHPFCPGLDPRLWKTIETKKTI